MSFFQVGDKFGVNQANLIKKLGYEDSSEPGTGEVRLFKENNKFNLKVWDGTSWSIINEVDDTKFVTSRDMVHGEGSGFIQCGYDKCDPGYQAQITRHYQYPIAFAKKPRVFLQHNLYSIQQPVAQNITTTGFDCVFHRMSSQTRFIDWMAIGTR